MSILISIFALWHIGLWHFEILTLYLVLQSIYMNMLPEEINSCARSNVRLCNSFWFVPNEILECYLYTSKIWKIGFNYLTLNPHLPYGHFNSLMMMIGCSGSISKRKFSWDLDRYRTGFGTSRNFSTRTRLGLDWDLTRTRLVLNSTRESGRLGSRTQES